MEIATWADLKYFVNKLDETQLKNKVVGHKTDSWSERCTEASALEEDYHIDDYGTMVPNSAFDDSDPDDKLEDWPKIPKGTPYLYFDGDDNWADLI